VAAEVSGDFDGDGAQDRFLVYEDSRGTHWARVELSYGYAQSGSAPESEFNVRTVNLGGPADLVAMDHLSGAPDRTATFQGLHECDLQHVHMPGGRIAQLLLRSSGTEKAGVTCTASGIIRTEAHQQSGGVWQASSVTYTWNPDAHLFEAAMGAAIVVLHSPEDDAEIESYADWDC